MGKVGASKSGPAWSKEALVEEFVDPRVEVIGNTHGEVEQTRIINNDLADGDLFPDFKPSEYMDKIPLENGEFASIWKQEYGPLRD